MVGSCQERNAIHSATRYALKFARLAPLAIKVSAAKPMLFCHPPPGERHPPPRSLPSAVPKSRQSSAPLRWGTLHSDSTSQPSLTPSTRNSPGSPATWETGKPPSAISSNRRPSSSATSGRVLVARDNHRRARTGPDDYRQRYAISLLDNLPWKPLIPLLAVRQIRAKCLPRLADWQNPTALSQAVAGWKYGPLLQVSDTPSVRLRTPQTGPSCFL